MASALKRPRRAAFPMVPEAIRWAALCGGLQICRRQSGI